MKKYVFKIFLNCFIIEFDKFITILFNLIVLIKYYNFNKRTYFRSSDNLISIWIINHGPNQNNRSRVIIYIIKLFKRLKFFMKIILLHIIRSLA